jgi:hypothetical protein
VQRHFHANDTEIQIFKVPVIRGFLTFDRCRTFVGNKYSYRRFSTLSLKYFKVDVYFES